MQLIARLTGKANGLREPFCGAVYGRRDYGLRKHGKRGPQVEVLECQLSRFAMSPNQYFTFVLHHDEEGRQMGSIEETMRRADETRVVQKYGRLYAMQLIRWLATILSVLSYKGAYTNRIEPLLGLEEPFRIFRTEDRYFLSRKTWSIY